MKQLMHIDVINSYLLILKNGTKLIIIIIKNGGCFFYHLHWHINIDCVHANRYDNAIQQI